MAKDGINRTITIPQPNIFGRIGTGLGKGLAEQLPKEIERSRLSSGLKELADQKGLNVFQQFAGLAAIPGAVDRPQLLQTAGELLRQQGIAQGFRNIRDQEQQNPFINPSENPKTQDNNNPSGLQPKPSGLVESQSTNYALDPYIPKSLEDLNKRAGELYDQNRPLYPDPKMAFQAAVQEDQQRQAISNAQQAKRQSQIGVEDRVRKQLSELRQSANLQGVPENVFQKVENDVLDKVAAGKEELQATKEGQKKLDEIGREYSNLRALGNWSFPLQSPSQANRAVRSSRNDFEKRDDLENFADILVTRGLTYPNAYHITFPIEKIPNLNRNIKNLPRIEQTKTEDAAFETQKIVSEIAKSMGKEGSPLSVGQELVAKGYDPDVWLDYLTKNKRILDLSQRQIRELEKSRNWFPSLNDLWFSIGNGQDKLLEE